MAEAFFIYNPKTKTAQERDDKVIPDPIILGDVEIIKDGKKILITATNGQEQYVNVQPRDYPKDGREREQRRGAIRSK